MDELHDLAEQLLSVSHFRQMSFSDRLAVVSSGQIRHFRSGETIVREGQLCGGMHVLLRGKIHLCKTGPHGQVGILAVIDPVMMFNEIALLDGGPNPYTAQAVEDSTTWQISFSAFQQLVQRYPQLGLSLLKVLAGRNRQMIAHYEDVSFRPVMARVAKLLLDLSENGAQKIQRNQHSINEMAARVATVPEAISRSLNTLKSQGLIECDRTQIAVIAPKELAKLGQIDE